MSNTRSFVSVGKVHRIAGTVVVLLSLSACAGSGSRPYVNPGYRGRDLSRRTVIVSGAPDYRVSIADRDAFDADFRTDADYQAWRGSAAAVALNNPRVVQGGFYSAAFTQHFRQLMLARWSGVTAGPVNRDGGKIKPEDEFVIAGTEGGKAIEVHLPTREGLLKLGVVKPDLAFLLLDLDVGLISEEEAVPMTGRRSMVSGNPVVEPGTASSGTWVVENSLKRPVRFLQAKVRYAVYDYVENQLVLYGRASGLTIYQGPPTRDHWFQIVDDLVRNLRVPLLTKQ
jgi:hypothetical protein